MEFHICPSMSRVMIIAIFEITKNKKKKLSFIILETFFFSFFLVFICLLNNQRIQEYKNCTCLYLNLELIKIGTKPQYWAVTLTFGCSVCPPPARGCIQCDMWHVTWHVTCACSECLPPVRGCIQVVTCDMWHVTCDMCLWCVAPTCQGLYPDCAPPCLGGGRQQGRGWPSCCPGEKCQPLRTRSTRKKWWRKVIMLQIMHLMRRKKI